MSEETCHVYIIAHMKDRKPVGPVKIGISSNPGKRLASLQTANPKELVLLCTFGTPTRAFAKELEGAFHYVMRSKRLAGEWFDIQPAKSVELMCSNFRGCFDRFLEDPVDRARALFHSGVLEAEEKLAEWLAFLARGTNDNAKDAPH